MTAPSSLASIHERLRARFPLLDRDAAGRPRVYLNSGAGSLVVDTAARAMAEAARLNPMPGPTVPCEAETAALHERARAIAADFLHAREPREISFHLSTTAALFDLAFSLRSVLNPSHNIVVTDLDHMANVSAWEDVYGRGKNCEIRRARVAADGTLDLEHLLSLVDDRTGVVAVTMASNGFGTIVPLGRLVPEVRRRSAKCLVVVDAVHHALHGPIDVAALDLDALAFSGYKVFGPMLGVLWGRKSLLDRARPYRVETNKDESPVKFEMGMLNNAALAALEAALEYLVWLAREAGVPESLPRPQAFTFALERIAEYERDLSRAVLEGFRGLDPAAFKAFGIADPARCDERDPTFAFEIAGLAPAEVKSRLWERHAVQIADGNHYSAAVVRHLGRPAVCRASFAHYDTPDTARRLVEALADVAAGAQKSS